MSKREWKVGERCWVDTGEHIVRGTIEARSQSSGLWRVEFDNTIGGSTWVWRASTAMFPTRLAAQIDDAKSLVDVHKNYHKWAVHDAQQASKRERRAAADLDKAKKRLAALREKGGAR